MVQANNFLVEITLGIDIDAGIGRAYNHHVGKAADKQSVQQKGDGEIVEREQKAMKLPRNFYFRMISLLLLPSAEFKRIVSKIRKDFLGDAGGLEKK